MFQYNVLRKSFCCRQTKKKLWKIPHIIKGGRAKMQMAKVCICHFSAEKHIIFKVFVPTPHNSLLIMGGSDNKFEDYLPWSRDMTKTKFDHLHFCSHNL